MGEEKFVDMMKSKSTNHSQTHEIMTKWKYLQKLIVNFSITGNTCFDSEIIYNIKHVRAFQLSLKYQFLASVFCSFALAWFTPGLSSPSSLPPLSRSLRSRQLPISCSSLGKEVGSVAQGPFFGSSDGTKLNRTNVRSDDFITYIWTVPSNDYITYIWTVHWTAKYWHDDLTGGGAFI